MTHSIVSVTISLMFVGSALIGIFKMLVQVFRSAPVEAFFRFLYRKTESKAMKQKQELIRRKQAQEKRLAEQERIRKHVESKAHGTTTKQIDSFKAELAELDVRQDRFVNLLADGTIDKHTYKRNAEKIIEDRSQLILQLEQLQKGLTSAVLDSAKTVLELAKSMKSIWKTMTTQERKEALDHVVSNPILNVTPAFIDADSK